MRIKEPLIHQSKKIYINKSPIHGIGVFAFAPIEKGEIIEVCPVVDIGLRKGESSKFLKDYRFNWPAGTENWFAQVMPLGWGCVYNHSDDPNADWRSIEDTFCFEYYALRKIKKYEEIYTWYGGPKYWNDDRKEINVI